MLEPLPHVGAVIDGADHERLARLLRRLIATLDDRAPRYAAARAGSITDYRQASGIASEPRILLLIDGYAAFREAYETTLGRLQYYAMATRLLAEGRSVGLHVIVSAERPSAIPASVGANIQRRLVLRQAEESGYLTLSVAKDILGPTSPPGRSVFAETDNEIQIAVPGGNSSPAVQAAAIDRLVDRMTAAGVPPAESVERLTTYVTLTQMPTAVEGRPVLGLCDDTLAPLGFTPQGAFLVAGQQGSGRSTALRTLLYSVHRWRPDIPLYYCGPRRSALRTEDLWTAVAVDPDAQKALAAELKPLVEEGADDVPGVIVFLEAVNEIVGTPSEQVLAEIIKLGKRNNHLIIGEAETSNWGTSWPIVSEIRNQRRGIVLQPDYSDGDALFRVSFPRMKRTDHPQGRALYVETGKYWTVQIPVPE
jgi:S-DNA-T family DNA segregation ATPase FtsK/SpoIIIE